MKNRTILISTMLFLATLLINYLSPLAVIWALWGIKNSDDVLHLNDTMIQSVLVGEMLFLAV